MLALAAALTSGCGAAPERRPEAPDIDDIDALLARGRSVYSKEGPAEALPLFERALAAYRERGDRLGEAVCLGLIGNCYKRFGDFPRARAHLEKALSLKGELGNRLEEGTTLNHLGLLFWEMGEYEDAVEHLNRSIFAAREVMDQELEAAALNNLSLVYDELGDYERSLQQYQRALELQRAAGDEAGESATLGNIGGVHLLLGSYRECLQYYEEALALSRRLELKPSESQDLGNHARCLLHLGRVDAARTEFQEALALARGAGLRKEEADWLTGLAAVWLREGEYEEALESYQKALETYERAGLKRELVEALNEVSDLQARLGDAAQAERAFRRAIDLAREIGYARGITMNLLTLGDLESRRNRPEAALALYREALSAARGADERDHIARSLIRIVLLPRAREVVPDADALANEAVLVARAMEAPLLEAEAFRARAELLRAQGRNEDALSSFADAEARLAVVDEPETRWRILLGRGRTLSGLGRRAEAVEALKEAVRTIEEVRARLRLERHRAGYLEERDQVYVELVELLLQMDEPREAFRFSEKLRARSFLDLLQRGHPPIRDRAKRQAERELLERIRSLDERVLAEGEVSSQGAVGALSSELRSAESDYAEFLGALRVDEPRYAAIRSLDVPSAGAIAERLPEKGALVEYLVAPGSLVVFVVTKKHVRALTVPVTAAELYDKVELLRDLLSRAEGDAWSKPAARLHSVLIEPIENAGWLEGVDELYLVPNGILHYVPFTALPRPKDEWAKYLLDDFTVTHLPQASVLMKQGGESSGSNLLALAPITTGLPLAVREVEFLGSLYAGAEILVGRDARESSFKAEAGRFRRLHLATHGYFHPSNPLLSGVELEAGEGEDGRLEVREILDLRLGAELVALSACETGLGSGHFTDIPAGDELVSLSRAFLYAGSGAVLASLWKVDDQSTLDLMSAFYQRLEREGAASALASAQRALRQGGRQRHPYFWAGFVLVRATI